MSYYDKSYQNYEYEDEAELYKQNPITVLREENVNEIRVHFIRKAPDPIDFSVIQ